MKKKLSPEESAEELAAERHDELIEVLGLAVKTDVGLAEALKQTLTALQTVANKDLTADLKLILSPIAELKNSVDKLSKNIQDSNKPKILTVIRDPKTDKIKEVIVKSE